MLQQTQVQTVIPYWERWMRELPDLAALAAAPESRVLKLWEGLGYYHRARNLQKAAKLVLARYEGSFPQTPDELQALPGIGRYTAGAVASIAFNRPAPILDGNVMRVLCRFYGLKEDPRAPAVNRKLWALAENWVQAADLLGKAEPSLGRACANLNQALMELGAMVCTPRAPQCAACPLRATCLAQALGEPEKLPVKARRAKATHRVFVAVVAETHGRFLVRQRPGGGVNADLWEFPNFEPTEAKAPVTPAVVRRELGFPVRDLRAWQTIRHAITRYRMELRAVRATATSTKTPAAGWRWVTLLELNHLALAGAHRRLARALEAEGEA
jgi:A/G-specific adenine glycosylase